MNVPEPSKPMNVTNITASVNGVLIGLAALIPVWVLSPDAKNIVAMVVGIVSPYIAAVLLRHYRKLDLDPALMDVKIRLEADLSTQNKMLKSGNLNKQSRKALEAKRDSTMLRIATLNQDFHDGNLSLKDQEE